MIGALPIRVTVEDTWDEVFLELPQTTTLAELKRSALDYVRVTRDPSEYVLKYRGAELMDEGLSLEKARLVPNAAVIVLSRRRRPVR